MKLTWFGTAAILLETENSRVLFDPFVPMRGSRVRTALSDYAGVDEILVTHGHFDHIRDIPELARRNDHIRVYCSQTPYHTLRDAGVEEAALVKIAPGDTVRTGDIAVRVYPGKHAALEGLNLSAIFLPRVYRYCYCIPLLLRELKRCQENGETLFFDIQAEGKHVFLLGSMNLKEDVAYPVGCDLLVLPYAGYKDNLSHAGRILERLQPKAVLLDHWDDTYPPVTTTVDTLPFEEKYAGRMQVIKPEYKTAYVL